MRFESPYLLLALWLLPLLALLLIYAHRRQARAVRRFVDPANPMQNAAVQYLGFRYGSVADIVTVTFRDAAGAMIGQATLPPTRYTTTIAYEVLNGAIHSVEFSQSSTDLWVIGSFTASTALTDIVFY